MKSNIFFQDFSVRTWKRVNQKNYSLSEKDFYFDNALILSQNSLRQELNLPPRRDEEYFYKLNFTIQFFKISLQRHFQLCNIKFLVDKVFQPESEKNIMIYIPFAFSLTDLSKLDIRSWYVYNAILVSPQYINQVASNYNGIISQFTQVGRQMACNFRCFSDYPGEDDVIVWNYLLVEEKNGKGIIVTEIPQNSSLPQEQTVLDLVANSLKEEKVQITLL